jgi:ABC-type Fe3+-hydroxamate transport system substrate-binding protein
VNGVNGVNGMEEKKENFKRVAEQRTNKIIKTIQLLGNCSNKYKYNYSEEQVKKIFNAIETELKLAKNKFESNKNMDKFTL